MLLAFVGPDRYLVGQALHNYMAKNVADDSFGDFNMTRLDGARLLPDELARAVQAFGFFGDRRTVIVEGLLTRFAGRSSDDGEAGPPPVKGRGKADPGLTEGFAGVFAEVPETTTLILVDRGAVAKNSSLLKAAARYGKVEEHITPKGTSLERWISEHAKVIGVRITPGALSQLAISIGDLAALSNELEKLSLYVGKGGTIDENVLRAMSWASKADDVFEMTSAAARRDTRTALSSLQKLMDGGTSPEGILPVLAWQIRTLIQVRDLLDQRVSEGRMAERSGLTDFTVRKAIGQAKQFSMKKLLDIHHKLLELDHGVKTGKADAELSLDALVVDMCK
ncbi:MAG: DNA polymerase III subunit delta [Chloroflexia bacterium]